MGLIRGAFAVMAAAFALSATPAAAACPGATPACPYSDSSQTGQRGGGVLRFPQTVAVGPDGAVYVGDQSSHIVQVFSPTGTFLREIGIAGSKPGELSSVGAIAMSPDNTLFVADGSNRIDRFSAAGQLLRSFGKPGAKPGELHFGAGGGNTAGAGGGLAVGGGFLFVSDSANDRLQRFGLDGSGATEIVAPGFLAYPRGLTVHGSRVVVADDQNHRLAIFDYAGKFIRTVGKGPGVKPKQLNFPYGVAIDGPGRVFVADDLNQRIVRYGPKPKYKYKARWGSYGTGPGKLAFPRAIAVDAAGLVYVTNTGNDRVDVFNRSGVLQRSFGSSGRATGQFDTPIGIASDASGMRAVADSINGRIQFLRPNGTIATVWGSPNPGPTILLRPVAVAFDVAGNAYVLDQRRSKIFVFDRSSGLPVRTIGKRGHGPGQLLDPYALAIDANGVIHVADTNNKRIARFTTGGTYLGSQTGTGLLRGIAVTPDGARTYVSESGNRISVYDAAGHLLRHIGRGGVSAGRLKQPTHLVLDAAENVWVADRGNNRIQEFAPDGTPLLMFGEKGTGPGQFVRPTSVDIDCNGLLTVADRDNNRVQQFRLTAPAVPACRSLPALGDPPRPQTPTLPSPPGPVVSVKKLRATKLFSRRTLALRVSCDTVCKITATGTLTQRSKPHGKHKRVTVSLHRVRVKLDAAQSKIIRLKLSRASVRRLRRALGSGHRLAATLQITARSPDGDPTEISKRLLALG
jgi:tripartite motif-containing protein 71